MNIGVVTNAKGLIVNVMNSKAIGMEIVFYLKKNCGIKLKIFLKLNDE